MIVVGTALNAPESAVVLARQNPLDLQGQATSPPPQQPELLDRVPLAIRHQEIPEPGFPHRCAPVPFDCSFTTHHLEDNYLSAVPACASPHLSASRTPACAMHADRRQAGADRPSTARARDIQRDIVLQRIFYRRSGSNASRFFRCERYAM